MLDLARARREAFFPLLGLDEFEHVSLPLGQHVVRMEKNSEAASSNEQL
jgi:hypothetical protein